jgi:hypothetical protein
MHIKAVFLRGFAAFAILAACGAEGLVTPAAGSTQPLIWQGVDSIRILCLVSQDSANPKIQDEPARRALEAEIAGKVAKLAAAGAPVPVNPATAGDPAVLDPAIVTLLVHASVRTDGNGRVLALHVRPFRAGGVEKAMLFGAAPRAVRLPQSGASAPELDAALAAVLAETLPWLSRPAGLRLHSQ